MSRQRPSVHIEDLLGPTSNNLLKGHLLRDNEDLSMRIVTQDAFGWQNWMEANSLSIEGSAQDIVFQAGQKIGWAPERIDEYLSDPSLRLNKAIPACVYKGNQDEEMEGSGDVSAWAHLFNLDSSFAHPDICPPQMKRVVEDHIDQYRDKVKVPALSRCIANVLYIWMKPMPRKAFNHICLRSA